MQGYNFTERTRKVLSMAREESARLRHEYVGTEHILLGLIREREGLAATVMQNLGSDLEVIQMQVEAVIKKGRASSTMGPDLPYTSRAKKVIELAMSEARALNHSYVGTEHLLLGLLAEGKGVAAQALNSSGVNLEDARAETLRILGTELPLRPVASGEMSPFKHSSGELSAVSHVVKDPPAGLRPARVGVMLHYSNGDVVTRSFDNAAEAATFLSAQ